MVRPVIRDGREWLVGSGFPGWSIAIMGMFLTVFFMGLPAFLLFQIWNLPRPTGWLAPVVIGLLCIPSLLLALVVLLMGVFAFNGLYAWFSVFWLSCDADGIHLRRSVLWGLINRARTIALDDVEHVTARLRDAHSKGQWMGKAPPTIACEWWEILVATKSGQLGHRNQLVMFFANADLAQGVTNLLRKRAGLPVDPNLTQKAIAEMESRWKQLSA